MLSLGQNIVECVSYVQHYASVFDPFIYDSLAAQRNVLHSVATTLREGNADFCTRNKLHPKKNCFMKTNQKEQYLAPKSEILTLQIEGGIAYGSGEHPFEPGGDL